MNHEPSLKRGTQVDFDIGQGLVAGKGVIADAKYDDGWLYRIDVAEGDHAEVHRNERGELWVCEFEVRPTLDHLAHEAEAAQQAGNWQRAAAIWREAAEATGDAGQRQRFAKQAAWCDDMASLVNEPGDQT